MKGVDFPEANSALHAPAGHEDEVYTLPILRQSDRVISCWELSSDDLYRITKTRRIYLAVMCQTHPPLRLMVDLFEESRDETEATQSDA